MVAPDGSNNLITHRGANHGTFYEASFMIDPTVPWGHAEKYKAALNLILATPSAPLGTPRTVSIGGVTTTESL